MIHWSWTIAGFVLGAWYGMFLVLFTTKREKRLKGGTRVTSPEDPCTEYLCFPDIRLIFYSGKYVGWYLPDEPQK